MLTKFLMPILVILNISLTATLFWAGHKVYKSQNLRLDQLQNSVLATQDPGDDLFTPLSRPVILNGAPKTFDAWGMSEPTIVVENGLFRLWYETLGDIDKSWRVGYAESTDGIHWEKKTTPALSPQPHLPFADKDVLEPWVMKDGDIYRMYFTADWEPDTGIQIGYAESKDGHDWKVHENPVLTKMNFPQISPPKDYQGKIHPVCVSEPSVVRVDDQLIMYYQLDIFEKNMIGYATSTDGIHWTVPEKYNLLPGNASLKGGIAGPCAIKHNGYIYLFYNSWGSNPRFERIYVAASKDGVNFVVQNSPVLSPAKNENAWNQKSIYEPAIFIREDGLVYMWYGGYQNWNRGYDADTNLEIGLAFGRVETLTQKITLP